MGNKLEIGGGLSTRLGFMQLDSRASGDKKINIITDEIPYDNNFFEIIYMSHIVEHIPLYCSVNVFNKILQKLTPGGYLRILCPDLEKIARAYVEKDYAAFESGENHWSTIHPLNKSLGIGGMFINQILSKPIPNRDADIDLYANNKKISSYAHVNGYDYEMLSSILKLSGFDKVERDKLRKMDTHQKNGQLIVNAWKAKNE